MDMKKAVMFLVLVGLFASLVSAQHFFDYGYTFGRDSLSGGGFGFISGLCDSYGEWFEFFIFFVVFFVFFFLSSI